MWKPYAAGIAGASAGGKSTLAKRLEERLSGYRVQTLHLDEYYKPEDQRPRVRGITDGLWYVDDNHPDAFDWERFCGDVEQALGEGWDVLLLEGILVWWEERIRSRLDLKVYVECSADERLVRRIRRHMAAGQSLEEITSRYVQAVQPRQKQFVEPAKWEADVIFNGFRTENQGITLLADWIRRRQLSAI